MAEYIVEKKQTSGGWTWAEQKGKLIRCKDCKYYREEGNCWHEWDNDGRIYYQSVINEPNPDDYCSKAERKEEWKNMNTL